MRLDTLFEGSTKEPSFSEIASDCVAAAKELKFDVKILENGAPIITHGTGDRILSMLSGLHGDERSGPIFLRHLLKRMASGKKDRIKVPFIMIPIVNDDGWDRITRKWHKWDLNRQFKVGSNAKIITDIMEALRAKPPFVHWDLHEHPGSQTPYIYDYSDDDTEFGKNLIKHMKVRRRPWRDSYDPTSESYVRLLGTERTVTTELPPAWPLHKRLAWLEKAYDHIIDYVAKGD